MSVASADHYGPWTVDDVLALPEDPRNRIELVGGALMMSPAPGRLAHQWASHRLHVLLEQAAEAAKAPVLVFDAINVLVPDGLMIPDLAVVDESVDLSGVTVHAQDVIAVVEIASPSTRVADRKMKPALYAAAGIEHYWRLEVEPAPRLYLGHLEHGAYADRLVQAGQTTAVTEPFPLDIDPARLVKR
ncbi:Uma2 family endonuclease [Actinacidiphila glaucinigra]|uniref:Uma2 family endonuclease n=1 Tax=Actinacidiphila glaucinigra TaxID=235986 RepID=UPI003672748C